MLKALTFGWFKGNQTQQKPAGDIPRSFTIPGRTESQSVIVSMKEGDEFVDIHYKQLSYAEAASLARNKKQTAFRTAAAMPRAERLCENQYEVLLDCPEDELLVPPEAFKTNNYFLKNKVYKEADRTRKRRKSLNKRS